MSRPILMSLFDESERRLATAEAAGTPLFVQISDTHIGFGQPANPDVGGTLTRAISLVNAMPVGSTAVSSRASLASS